MRRPKERSINPQQQKPFIIKMNTFLEYLFITKQHAVFKSS